MRIYKVYSGIRPQVIFRIAKGNFSSRLSALVMGMSDLHSPREVKWQKDPLPAPERLVVFLKNDLH